MLFGNTVTVCEVVKMENIVLYPAVKKLCFLSQVEFYSCLHFCSPLLGFFGCNGAARNLLQDQFFVLVSPAQRRKAVFKYKKRNKKKSPHGPQSCFYCSFESQRRESAPSLFCCTKLWLVALNGPEPGSAFQLSEAVVGGRVPRRLAQQTVCGVFG